MAAMMADVEIASNKAGKTITFDRNVLNALEIRSKKNNTTVSKLVNSLCRRTVLSDSRYYDDLAKYHARRMHEAQVSRDSAIAAEQANGGLM